MNEYLELSYWQVSAAALLIVINGVISACLRLGLSRSLCWAAIRTITQLALVGLVLEWIFRSPGPWLVLLAIGVMTAIAGKTANDRLTRPYDWSRLDTFLAMGLSSWMIGLYALSIVFHGVQPWYQPQYAIPLMGMILGNTLNGISIGLNAMITAICDRRQLIESRLALGANRWEAIRPELQAAARAGMTPIINAMMVVGIVNLPGMMTGQLLAGTKPVEAVKYQIVIMFLIASATAIGTVLAILLGWNRIMDRWHQLRFDRIRAD